MAMLAGAAGRVAAGRMSKAACAELEVATGFRHNPHGVTQSEALRLMVNPIEVASYDWVHSVLQSGILVAEIEALLAATSLPRDALQAFLADKQWQFPHCSAVKSRQLHRIFDGATTTSRARLEALVQSFWASTGCYDASSP